MPTTLSPYLGFRGNAREAMEFYRSVLGGELTVSTFADYQAQRSPEEAEWVMHSQLTSPGGVTLMGSDTPVSMPYTPGDTYSVALFGDDEAELTGFWAALAEGATITMQLAKAPWGDSFGMLVDRFGVTWMINISGTAG